MKTLNRHSIWNKFLFDSTFSDLTIKPKNIENRIQWFWWFIATVVSHFIIWFSIIYVSLSAIMVMLLYFNGTFIEIYKLAIVADIADMPMMVSLIFGSILIIAFIVIGALSSIALFLFGIYFMFYWAARSIGFDMWVINLWYTTKPKLNKIFEYITKPTIEIK